MKPYYCQDGITIYHGDCGEVLPQLASVDLVVTSPPYNVGMHPSGKGSGMHAGSGYTANGKTWNRVADSSGGYGAYNDALPQAEYDAWQTRIVTSLWDLLTEQGAIFYNHKPRSMNGVLHLPLQYGAHLLLRQIITWDRGLGMNFSTSFFLPKSEWVIVWAKPQWRLVDRGVASSGDVWRFPPEMSTDHPAPFPVALPTRAISATDARLVLDPFMGSGTTLVAAKRLGRKAVGIELEEKYCEIAAKRLQQGALPMGFSA